MADFTVQDQLKNLSDEELEQLEQELKRKQQGDVATTISGGLLQGARGALAVSQGRALPGREKETKAGEDIETFEKKERIKAQIKQEFGGTGGMQILQLPGGGFAVVPGGQIQGQGVGETANKAKTGILNGGQKLEDVTITAGGLKGKVPKSSEQLERELTEDRQKTIGKGAAEAVAKSTTAQRMSLQQIDLIANSAKLLSQTHVDAIKEGGLGSLVNEYRGKISLFFGGEQAEAFGETESFPGLKTEIISRLMPTLTQQGDKPGSVRLVQTIFAKLELTLPGSRTPTKNARKMMTKTLTNAFNFARAAERLGLTNESVENMSDEQLVSFSDKVSELARSITLTESEQDALNLLLSKSLAPYDEFILERGDKEAALKERFGLE